MSETIRRASNDELNPVHAETLGEALRLLRKYHFDAVLMDLNLTDSQGLSTFVRTTSQHPELPIVVLSGLPDAALALAAVREGAEDYLVKGAVTSETIVRVLRYAIARRRSRRQQPLRENPRHQGRVFGFLGAKGGVGTSTVALNVAQALAERHDVVLADFRSHTGSLASMVGRIPTTGLGELLELDSIDINEQAVASRLTRLNQRLRLLASPQRPAAYGPIDPDQAEAIVRTLKRLADFVILDLAPGSTAANEAIAPLCQQLVLVLDRETICVQAARWWLGLLSSWAISENSFSMVLVNRVNLPLNLDVDEIRRELGCRVLGLVPAAAEACAIAVKAGQTVLQSATDSPVAVALREVATRLAELGSTTTTMPAGHTRQSLSLPK